MEWFNVLSEYGVTICVIVAEAFGLVTLYKDNKAVRDKNDERIEDMLVQIGELTQSVNNNTVVISKLVDKMDSKGGII